MKLIQGLKAGLLLFLIIALYILALVVVSPFFLLWPSRYPDLTYIETVATRWKLVRHILRRVTGTSAAS